MTIAKLKSLLERHLNKTAERLGYLAGRWEDEKEYEDWKDYETELKKLVPEGFKWVGATSDPFGFTAVKDNQLATFLVDGEEITLDVTLVER